MTIKIESFFVLMMAIWKFGNAALIIVMSDLYSACIKCPKLLSQACKHMVNTPSSKLVHNIFFSFAEFERDMIAERTREGKAIARTKAGFREGRPPKFTPEQLRHALELLENHSYKQVSAMTKISKSTLQRAKRGTRKLR